MLSVIDAPQILELRRMISADKLDGSRILAGTIVPVGIPTEPGQPGDPARTDVSSPPARPTVPADAAAVQAIADAGSDIVKTVITITLGGSELDTLTLIVEEAHKHGLASITHAVSVIDTLAAIQSGTDRLVYTPYIGQLTEEEAQIIADSGIPITSTLGTFVPFYDDNNQPVFRDALPYPWHTLSSAGQGSI